MYGLGLEEINSSRNFRNISIFSQTFCPNPCKPIPGVQNNPCVSKKNTKNHDCNIVNTKLILFDNNYKCNCKINYEWDALKEECALVKGSCYGKGRCNETNTIFCEIQMHSKEEIALLSFDYEINCECLPSYMGTDCSNLRNSCIENYYRHFPSGNAACGLNGKCIPLLGTNDYKCLCNPGWYDDNTNEFLDCYQFIDKCNQVYCYNNGYCKSSANNQKAICVCNQYYTGANCEIPRTLWLQWELWSTCEPTCGFDRIRKRNRKCPIIYYKNEPDDNSTLSCYFNGDLGPNDFELCEFVPCPSESKWSAWDSWSECSTSCDHGYRKRERYCIFKYDMIYNQKNHKELFTVPCIGLANDYKYCNLGKCTGNVLDYFLIFIVCLAILKFLYIIVYYFKHFYKLLGCYNENRIKLRDLNKKRMQKNKSINLERYSIENFNRNSVRKSTAKVSIVSSKSRNSLRNFAENRRSLRELSKTDKASQRSKAQI